jgi:hypothetical protein
VYFQHTYSLLQAGQCVRCAHCCPVNYKFAPRGAQAMQDTLLVSGMRIQWVALQATWLGVPFEFRRQSAVTDWPRLFKKCLPFRQWWMAWWGTVAPIYLKYLTALLGFVGRFPIVSGATPPSLWAIFIMPLHGIRHRQLTPSMAISVGGQRWGGGSSMRVSEAWAFFLRVMCHKMKVNRDVCAIYGMLSYDKGG